MNIRVLVLLIFLSGLLKCDLLFRTGSLTDELEHRLQTEATQKLSNECIRRNLMISKREQQRILFLTENKNTSADVQAALLEITSHNGNGVNMVMDSATITSLDTDTASGYIAFNYVIVLHESLTFFDAKKLCALARFTGEIHIIHFRQKHLNRSEFEKVSRSYFRLCREAGLNRVRLHVGRKMGDDEYVWRLMKPNRQRGIEKLAECHFAKNRTVLLKFKEKTACNGCAFRILARKFEPYTFFEDEKGFYKGIEISMVTAIARELNMKATYVLDSNSTGGAFKTPIEDRLLNGVDMIIGGFGNISIPPSALVTSYPYWMDDSTWCVTHATYHPPWVNLFIIIADLRIFFLNVFVFLLGAGLTFCFTTKRDVGRDMCFALSSLMYFQIALCFGSKYRSKNSVARFMSVILIFGCFFHYLVFTSYYLNIIVFPIEQYQIKTRNDLITRKFELAGDKDSLGVILAKHQVNGVAQALKNHFVNTRDIACKMIKKKMFILRNKM